MRNVKKMALSRCILWRKKGEVWRPGPQKICLRKFFANPGAKLHFFRHKKHRDKHPKNHALIAQRQSTSLVNWGSWVQTPQEATYILYSIFFPGQKCSQLAGFEPTRAEPIGFQVQRLNHSATTALQQNE